MRTVIRQTAVFCFVVVLGVWLVNCRSDGGDNNTNDLGGQDSQQNDVQPNDSQEQDSTVGDTNTNTSQDSQNDPDIDREGMTIYDVQDPGSADHPADGTVVSIESLIVTALDNTGSNEGSFWVQEASGGPYSGIYVFNKNLVVDSSALSIGSRVSITGTYKEFNGLSEIEITSIDSVSEGIQIQPQVVSACDIATGGPKTAEYEGVLVRVEGVTVASIEEHGEFKIDCELLVDDEIFHFDTSVGAEFQGITGILHFAFEANKLLVRDVNDITCDSEEGCNPTSELSISDIQDENSTNYPGPNSSVALNGVTVTAISDNGNLFVQNGSTAAPFNGIRIFNQSDVDVGAVQVGSIVNITGTYTEFYEESQVTLATIDFVEAGSEPTPIVVDPADVATGGSMAEDYEGVLVTVEDVEVLTVADEYGEFEVTDNLRIDDGLYEISDVTVGDTFSSITGVMRYGYDNTKLLPRSESDVQ